jgi:hypothetical protein
MKKLLLIGAALVAGLFYYTNPTNRERSVLADTAVEVAEPAQDAGVAESETDTAYADKRSNVQVQGSGTVSRVLPDDNDGSRHQRFILKLDSGLTVLVAHNVDLAPRIDSLQEGDEVGYYGEYEWNAKGGVVHWTHHDPRGSHVGGWLKHKGRTYQ